MTSLSHVRNDVITSTNYLISGQDASHIFSVKIASTESVDALKTAIKNLNPQFGNIPAHTLDLFKVSFPAHEIK